jgi:hypothetical protein
LIRLTCRPLTRQRWLRTGLALLSLCAACEHGQPTLPTSQVSSADWYGLRRVPVGARLRVTLADAPTYEGVLSAVDDDSLVVKDQAGQPRILERTLVERVVEVRTKARTRAKQWGIAGGVLGSVLVVTGGPGFWFFLVIDPPALAGLGALYGLHETNEVVVYQRARS